MKLTKTQGIAAHAAGRPILLSAGAGTGKTRVLVERFLHFVTTGKALVTEILALTFTEKAAGEMKSRIMMRLMELGLSGARRDLESAYISTIHAFGARLLKEHPVEAAVHPDFRVIESDEAGLIMEEILDEVMEKLCLPESGVFQILKTYGESEIRKGILKIHQSARVEGRSLEAFFNLPRPLPEEIIPALLRPTEDLFLALGEKELALEWKAFVKKEDWDWNEIDSFRQWMKPFTRKKKEKEKWQELAQNSKQLLAAHFEILSQPWRARFNELALAFEQAYEARKKEEGFLDFQDLEIKTVQLLSSERPGNRKIRERYQEHFKWILIDEFQDTNPLQLRLIETLSGGRDAKTESAGKEKLFYVGDYKQSIYSFRGTSPEHFLEKEKECGIPMLENFRTAPEILDFINPFFSRLWEEDNFAVPGLTAMRPAGVGRSPEVQVIRQQEDENMEGARMREAAWIAQKIQALHEEGSPYGGMAILFQAMTASPIYEQALKNAGIPYFVVSGRGFYYQPEIRDMMNLLALVENPLQDIPLAAVLRSPLFRVSEEALYWLSKKAKEKDENQPLLEGLRKLESAAELSAADKSRLQDFLIFFDLLLNKKDELTVSELLEFILRQTDYELWALHDRQGVRRYSNLKKLVEIARNFESRERASLGDFVRMIESFESREIRESEAQVEAEESGRVVRLMTIHAAKGLEFPVCILADLGYQAGNPESRIFLADPGQGYGLKIRNEKSQEWEESLFYQSLDEFSRRRENGEWKRLFYVAMTRAQDRLILSGVYKEKKDPAERFDGMSSWMEWIMRGSEGLPLEIWEGASEFAPFGKAPEVLAQNSGFQKMIEAGKPDGFGLFEKSLNKEEIGKFSGEMEKIFQRFSAVEMTKPRSVDLPVSAYCAFAKDPLEYWRVYEMGFKDSLWREDERNRVPEEEGGTFPPLPGGSSAADFGTQIHKALEWIDFKNPEPALAAVVREVFAFSTEAERTQASGLLSRFFKSEVFRKVRSAKKIYKELGFVLNERHGRIDGVIDLLFQDENGKWHILDYKTAVGDEARVHTAHYDFQISTYALAVSEILGEEPLTGSLYFLKNDWNWEMAFDKTGLKGAREHLRRMQEEILEYRWQQLQK